MLKAEWPEAGEDCKSSTESRMILRLPFHEVTQNLCSVPRQQGTHRSRAVNAGQGGSFSGREKNEGPVFFPGNDGWPGIDSLGLCAVERPGLKPRKILLIGTLGSGKTTVAERLSRDTGLPYTSIDGCRIRYGDGTIEGEARAWEYFLEECCRPAPGILEFCGMGPHVVEVRDNLLCSTIPVSVIWLVLPLDTCITRASQRQKKIPYPFEWAPVAYSAPLIHDGIDIAWDIIWSESLFHATRQEFSGTASVDEVYSVIREICSSTQ